MKLLVLALASAFVATARAQSGPVYKWETAATPPANAVTAPDGGKHAVCRANGPEGHLWAGYWDGKTCTGSYNGATKPGHDRLQFLTLVSGTVGWRTADSRMVPSNAIIAGKNRDGDGQVICSQGGYVGWWHSACQLPKALGNLYPAPYYLLVGELFVPSVYGWKAASAPPANVVTAPDGAKLPVCRGTGKYDYLWVGWWDGHTCVSGDGGRRQDLTAHIEFLTQVSGTVRWVSGTRKEQPGNVGDMPSGAVSAGMNFRRDPLVICSRGGYVGFVQPGRMPSCSLSSPSGLGMDQNATVLVGAIH